MSKNASKSDELFSQIRTDILTLELQPSSPLRLPALSEKYGAGTTPLRECLNRLSAECLVTIEHNKGFQVAGISPTDLLDLERSRSAIEGALFVLSIQQGDDEWEAKVIGSYHQLARTSPISPLSKKEDLEVWNRRHKSFHHAIIASANSPCMHHFRCNIEDKLSRYLLFIQNGLRDLATTHPVAAQSAVEIYAAAMASETHEPLYQAVLDRDIDMAKTSFEEHVNLSIHAFEQMTALLPSDAFVSEKLGQ